MKLNGGDKLFMMEPSEIQKLIQNAIPESEVSVEDFTGGGDHFEIQVVTPAFEDMPLVERHRWMHRILEAPMEGAIHAIKLVTLTPAQKAQRQRNTY